jgi:predicted TIM-barrel fold metal-dependent hydrolase
MTGPDDPMTGTIDTLCNAFAPEFATAWDQAIAAQGIPIKVRRDPDDSFATPGAFVARMDELGIATVALVVSDPHAHPGAFDFSALTYRLDDVAALVDAHPGRFVAHWCLDPSLGMTGVRRAAEALAHDWVVGLYHHVHSWDRPFDHADLYPFYALASDHDVPVMMQAGTSGGLMPSECGRPIGVDRPAIYFRDVRFVLSHTGWPWVDEAVAMALKFPNVYLGTAAYPPRHWAPAVVDFVRGPGRDKTIFATNFPAVGHRHALGQIPDLDLASATRDALLGGTARRVFTRLP